MYDIELKAISKTYTGSNESAVSNFSLAVEKGTILTLLGPSGCGKTTTLRLIAGFERADKGTISLGGKVVSNENTWIPPESRGVGMVFQDYALFPHLNVFNNIGFGYKEWDRSERVQEVMELVNLQGFEKRFPHELSGGQQQRVALARALTRRPVVVLLDEPFSNLDADLRSHMRMEIKRIIKNAGTTAVFVSHDQKDALAISDKIVVMKDGFIQQVGTPRDIYQFPVNKFVATFIGNTNILDGTISADGRSVDTVLGVLPVGEHYQSFVPGERVYVSVRPENIHLHEEGTVMGRVEHTTYTGEIMDVIVKVDLKGGSSQELFVHLHPDGTLNHGDVLSFNVTPGIVALKR